MYDDSVLSLRRLAVAGLAAVVGWGCSSEAPRDTTQVRVGLRFDYPTPNELIAPPTLAYAAINNQLYLSLMEEQGDLRDGPLAWAPGLAEEWQFSEDRLQLTLRLRPDALWSDGQPVTAEDVRFTWLAQTDLDVAWNYASSKESITEVEVVDARTVRFHFSAATGTQLDDIAPDRVLPGHAWESRPFAEWRSDPGWFFEHLVTGGPFRLASRTPGSELVLERNPDHFEAGLPRLERVVLRTTADSTALTNQLLAGELDVVTGIGARDALRIEGQPGLRLLTYPNRQFTFVSWNATKPWFRDPATRRALALAIDRQAIVDTIWHGYAQVGGSPIISSVWAHDPDLEPWPHDTAAARATLAEAGWMDADGDGILERGGVPFRFELATFYRRRRALGSDADGPGRSPRRRHRRPTPPRRPERIDPEIDGARLRRRGVRYSDSHQPRPALSLSQRRGRQLQLRRLRQSRGRPAGRRLRLPARPAGGQGRSSPVAADPARRPADPCALGIDESGRIRRELESVAPNAVGPLVNLKEWAWRE